MEKKEKKEKKKPKKKVELKWSSSDTTPLHPKNPAFSRRGIPYPYGRGR